MKTVSVPRVLLLSLLLVLCSFFVAGDSCGDDCDDFDCGSNYSCSCYNGNNFNSQRCASCSLKGGNIAGIVIGSVVFVLIICCLCYACRRRGYYGYGGYGGYGGQTYTTSATAVPMQGYTTNAYQQPVQAIPVQYASPVQQNYGDPVYAQQPVGGGQAMPQYAASAPPPYGGQSYQVSEPYQEPTKRTGTAI